MRVFTLTEDEMLGERDEETPCDDMGEAQCCSGPKEMAFKKPDMKRKEELFQLAKQIALLVEPQTHRRERRLLCSMVEMLLQ